MKFATKMMLVPYAKSIEKPIDSKVSELDSQMTGILKTDNSYDDKIKLYNQTLAKFINNYDLNTHRAAPLMVELVQKLSDYLTTKESVNEVKKEPESIPLVLEKPKKSKIQVKPFDFAGELEKIKPSQFVFSKPQNLDQEIASQFKPPSEFTRAKVPHASHEEGEGAKKNKKRKQHGKGLKKRTINKSVAKSIDEKNGGQMWKKRQFF